MLSFQLAFSLEILSGQFTLVFLLSLRNPMYILAHVTYNTGGY